MRDMLGGVRGVRSAAVLAALLALGTSAPDPFARPRAGMIEAIARDVRGTSREIGRREADSRVMQVLSAVPRHAFVPDDLQRFAYENRPLPIGYGQTISQPFIVAIMTDLLDVDSDDVVLEVGTGSGYQAAVLSRLVSRVYSVEIIGPLANAASERLGRLGYHNVFCRRSDGYNGWAEAGPFDAIIVTAAASHIPPPLVQQLKPGGKMIIPVGDPFTTQYLLLISKTAGGKITTRQLLPVVFVPLTRNK